MEGTKSGREKRRPLPSAPFSYRNRRGDVYYLHRRVAATGRTARYVMNRSAAGALDALAEGFEVVENLNGQVSVRAVKPRIITIEEEALANERLGAHGHGGYRVEVKGAYLVIHELHGPSAESLERLGPFGLVTREALAAHLEKREGKAKSEAVLRRVQQDWEQQRAAMLADLTRFDPILRFHLADKSGRLFTVERMSFSGKPDWSWLDDGLPLREALDRFLPPLGTDEFFEMV